MRRTQSTPLIDTSPRTTMAAYYVNCICASHMKTPASLRTLLLFIPYAFAVWMTAYRGLRGDDAAGLVCVLLLLGGAALLVNLAFFRRTVQPRMFSTAAAGALALLGLGFGAMSAGESGVGVVAGLAIGGVAAVVIALSARRKRRRPRTIFLSYRRADSGDVVPRIRERLTERFGAENIFWDLDSMELGGRFREIIADAVNHADALIAIIGAQWLSSKDEAGRRRIDEPDDLVRIEIETALRTPRLLVVPLAVKDANIPQPGELPESMRDLVSRSGGVIRSPPDFEADMSRLIRGLEQGAVTPWSRAAPTPVRWSRVAAMAAIVVVPPAGLLLEVPAAAYRSVNDAALRPGASMLATAHGVGIGVRSRVRLWNTDTGAMVHTLDLDEGPVWSVAWSPNGSYLAYGDHDGTLVIRQSDTWREQARFEQHAGMLQQLAWAPSGDLIASGDERGMVRVWSISPAELRFATLVHTNRVEMVRWSPDGSRLATASWDQMVAITDAATGDVVHRFEGHRSFVNTVA